ncbi:MULTISPECIES: ABC transporter permease [unclassified Methanoregula]|uniref:ABC transporter permease n=1 Tax=unclassified Methanoregula TaxID=2649730 RepID=UPI0009CA3DF9|nr:MULTISPECIES: ABC transporter permease [unclassified Methanoregula]OPX64366.1 MAG: ABC-2 type transporter [Methanoregula sp. PtaB.Bin085]OPY34964.1 MAG: ABC-2 type transporter [Methanoregula sp. PtaU1.Bin006]
MDLKRFVWSVLMVTEKNMRIYYYKGSVVIFGLLFPFIMFLTFFIGRDLDLVLFFPGFLGMMLFFSASSTGPLITPWEKREKTYERLVSLPVVIESIILGDILSGAVFGFVITTLVWLAGSFLLHLSLTNPAALVLALLLGSLAFAALGTLLSSPATDTPSNIMMFSNLVRLPLIFVSGIFIPLNKLGDWAWTNLLSPLTYLVDLFHTAITGDGVYSPVIDSAILIVVIIIFASGAKLIQQHNLHNGR